MDFEGRSQRERGLRLSYCPPLAMVPLLRFFGDRAIPGVESFDGRTFRRSLRAGGGQPVVMSLTPEPGTSQVVLDFATAGAAMADVDGLAGIVRTARRLLDLDAEPEAVDAVLSADPALRPLVEATPGIRLPGCADRFELAVRAILGQQVSVRAARTLAGRIVSEYGTPIEPLWAVSHVFPTAEQLAEAPLEGVGLTQARAATLRQLARLIASGDIDLSGDADPEVSIEKLLAVRGIGPWTASYVAMRAFRDPDAFPAADLGVRYGFDKIGLPSALAAIRRHADCWRPWRAYAVMHLWNAHT